jgi:tetratricopeptide (TPR) repeat protein
MMAAADGIAAVLASADAALRAGNALLCFELIERAKARGVQDPDLEYRAVLALAHCGNARQALDRYHSVAHPNPDQEWLALEGRLFKDLAAHDGAAASFMYARAAQAYWQAFEKTGGYFSAVNAATTFVLAGDVARGEAIARDVLTLTGRVTNRDPLEQYNLLVTHAEAALLLGEHERCREHLRLADQLVPDHRAARARTVHQLRLICRHLRAPKGIVELLRVPPHIWILCDELGVPTPDVILEEHLAKLAPPPLRLDGAVVHLALRGPGDLWVAAYLQMHGAQLCCVLPGSRDKAMGRWQQAHGAGWAMRLAQTLGQASDVSFVTGHLDSEPLWERQGLVARALGLSRLMPPPLRSEWFALEVRAAGDGFIVEQPAESRVRDEQRRLLDTQVPLSEEPRSGGVRERRLVAFLEVRVHGIDALADHDHPRCWSRLLGGFAGVLDEPETRLIERRRLGHAIRLIGADADRLANLAHRLHAVLDKMRNDQEGFAGLTMQTLLHFGPVFVGDDPVETRQSCYGAEPLHAGRLVAQVPSGLVLATEPFAARLVHERPEQSPTYAGEILLDRQRERLFSLARSPA